MNKLFILWVALAAACCLSCTDDDDDENPSVNSGEKGTISLVVNDYSVSYLTIHTFREGDPVTVNWGDGSEERFKAVTAYDPYDQEINGYWIEELEHSYANDNPHTITITGHIKGLKYEGYGLALLDASQCPGLVELDCCDNEITSLNLSNCAALAKLCCEDNDLRSLNLSGCTALQELKCSGNELTALDASGCTALKTLDCSDNRLATLKTDGCAALIELNCANNDITALNLTDNRALEALDCRNNRLTELDITPCTRLKSLHCQGNTITSLDVSQCPELEDFQGWKQGDWSRSYSFAGHPRVGAVSFTMTIDGKEYAFVGLGRNENIANSRNKTLRDFWRFDGHTWVQQDSFPGAGRYGAVAFVAGGKAYVGTGYRPAVAANEMDIYYNDFYEFDPAQPQGSQWKKTPATTLPGEGRWGAVAFSLGGKRYVGTGFAEGSRVLRDMWEYDPATDEWQETAFIGDSRGGAVAFVVDGKAVVCLGSSSMSSSSYCEDVNIFDGKTWTVSPNPLRDLSGRNWDDNYGRIPRSYAIAFTSSIDGGTEKGYIATGAGNYANSCWEYDPREDRWREVVELPAMMSSRAYAVGFTLNNYGYVTLGGSALTNVGDALTWKFTPGADENEDNDYTPQD